MARNQVRFSKSHPGQVAWQLSWKGAIAWGISLSLVIFAWLYLRVVFTLRTLNIPAAGVLLTLFVVHGFLAVILERSLTYTPLRREWRYRLAFLASAGLACLQWSTHFFLLLLIPSSAGFFGFSNQFMFVPLVAALGAFGGSLFTTRVNDHLWENNSPPAERLQAEVYQMHIALIGQASPGPLAKRLFDFCLALSGILISAPLWVLFTFLLWFEEPGPILFVKNSVGKGGHNFHQFKFRTMVSGAEDSTGPILSQDGDQRVLIIGRLLRKTALDELPQLINILRGEMSLVGPRPQRTVLVHGYLQRMPEYAQRHRVLPGLSGLAQVAGDYYLTPRQKLRFDRLYIRYTSLGFDLKLLWLAFLITFWFRWQKGWNGRLPRRLLRLGSRAGIKPKTKM